MENKTKEQLIEEFLQMKALEESAADFYSKVSIDSRLDNEEFKIIFKKISLEEEEHTRIVQNIVNIIKNNL